MHRAGTCTSANAGRTATDAVSVAVRFSSVRCGQSTDFDFLACCMQNLSDRQQVLSGGGHLVSFGCFAYNSRSRETNSRTWSSSPTGEIPLEFCHHFIHLIGIDRGVIPTNAVVSGTQKTTDLSVSHTANEFGPGCLSLCKLNASAGGVVQEFVVPDPEGSVPGFVVCPTVHDVFCLFVLLFEFYRVRDADAVLLGPVRLPSQYGQEPMTRTDRREQR